MMSRFIKIDGVAEVQDTASEDAFLDEFMDFMTEASEAGENSEKARLCLDPARDEYDFLLDILEEAMLLPYDTEEYQEMVERFYKTVKEKRP